MSPVAEWKKPGIDPRIFALRALAAAGRAEEEDGLDSASLKS